MANDNIIRFPTARLANARFMPSADAEPDDILVLEQAWRSACHARNAARAQSASLMLRLWRAKNSKPCKSTFRLVSDEAAYVPAEAPVPDNELIGIYDAVPPAKRAEFLATMSLLARLAGETV